MAASAVASGIDDSFEDIIAIGATRARHEPGGEHGLRGGRSEQCAANEGTVFGSGIDDSDTILNFVGHRTGGPDVSYGTRRHIPGAVLDRFAKANAADRERERRRRQLEVIAEKDADGAIEQRDVNQGRATKHESKFYVPKLDSRGIRTKGRDGRSEIVREPSLPHMPSPNVDGLLATEKMKKASKAEPARAPSPAPSVRTGRTVSACQGEGVLRIVGKDGQQVFMPLPRTIGPFSSGGSAAKAMYEYAPQQGKSPAKERARRDTKATKAAKEIRREMEIEELQMSGALGGSVAGGRSARSSKAHSSRNSSLRMEEVFEKVAVASSRTSLVKSDVVKEKVKSQQKATKKPDGKKQKGNKTKDTPKEKPSPKDKPSQAPNYPSLQHPSEQPSLTPWEEEPKQSSKPPSKASSKHDLATQHSQHSQQAPSERSGQHADKPSRTIRRPPSVRSAFAGSKTSNNGRGPGPSPLGWETIGEATVRVSSGTSAAKSTGFHHVGEGTYEPFQSSSKSRSGSRHSSLPSTPSAQIKHPSPVRSGFSTQIFEKACEHAPIEAASSNYNHAFQEQQAAREREWAPNGDTASEKGSSRRNSAFREARVAHTTSHAPPSIDCVSIKHEHGFEAEASYQRSSRSQATNAMNRAQSSAHNHAIQEAQAVRAASAPPQSSPADGNIGTKREDGSGSRHSYQTSAILRVNNVWNGGHQPYGSSGTSYGYPADGSGTPSPPVMHGFHRPSSASSHPLSQRGSMVQSPLVQPSYLHSGSIDSQASYHSGSPVYPGYQQRGRAGPVPVAFLQRPGSMASQLSVRAVQQYARMQLPTSFEQHPGSVTMQPFVQRSVSAASQGFVQMGSGMISPQGSATSQQHPVTVASPPLTQRPSHPTNEYLQQSSSPFDQRYVSPLQQARREFSPQQPFARQPSTFSAHHYQSPMQHTQSPPPQTSQDLRQTVFAGRGWISPHPLSAASSGNQPPESAIRIPAGHPALRGSHDDVSGPAILTYSEYKEVQERKSVISEHVGSSGHPQQVLSADGSGSQRSDGRRDAASIASERSDGKVQLKMPWDADKLDGLF